MLERSTVKHGISASQVVLVESDAKARRQAESQLEALAYVGTDASCRLATSWHSSGVQQRRVDRSRPA